MTKNISLVASLALYQNRRDVAVGIKHIGTKQRGLVWYYNYLQQENYKRLLLNSFQLGIIQGARKRIEQIKNLVTVDMPIDEATRLYQEALELQSQIDKASGVING